MEAFERAEAFVRDVNGITDPEGLAEALGVITREMGFRHFALSHHVDIRRAAGAAVRLHNYPDDWAEFYDENSLGPSDPVHRASHLTSMGFAWSQIPQMIELSPRDQEILEHGRSRGIGDGFTIPAHVPGEANGSCSFANPADVPLPGDALPLAQLVGGYAFEAARRLWRVRETPRGEVPRLTDRQRDCIVWMARGKSDWEIARILGIEHQTVVRHVKLARERYGVGKRTLLAIQALFDGSISFHDILKR